jgi:type I restriction enzyme S subunit
MDVRSGYKLIDMGTIPQEWNLKCLGDLASISAGGTPSRAVAQFWNGDIPWVTTAEVDFNTITHAEQSISKEGLNNSAAKLLPPGTLLMALYGQGKTRGKVGVLGIEAATNQACAAISLDRSVLPEFIFHYLASHYESIRKLSNTGNQENLNGTLVRSISILVPPPREQHAIAEALSNVDGLLGGLDRLIAKKRDLKQAAMQQLLTGQSRLPGYAGDWESKRLGEVADVLKGSGLSRSALTPSGQYSCLLYGELFTTYGRVIDTVVGRTDRPEGVRSMSGDVLMPGSTTTTGADLAIASALMVDGVLLGGDINIVRRRTVDVHPAFLANYLTNVKRAAIAELAQGITIHHLYGRDLKTLLLALPKPAEQSAIARVLLDMEAELASLQLRRGKTRALKQAMMQELLTGRTRLVKPEPAYA